MIYSLSDELSGSYQLMSTTVPFHGLFHLNTGYIMSIHIQHHSHVKLKQFTGKHNNIAI